MGLFDEHYHWECTSQGQQARYQTDQGTVSNLLKFHKKVNKPDIKHITSDILTAVKPTMPHKASTPASHAMARYHKRAIRTATKQFVG
jgi:hypothetical protein